MPSVQDEAVTQDEAEKAASIEARLQEEKRAAAAATPDVTASSLTDTALMTDSVDATDQEAALTADKAAPEKSQLEQLTEAGVDELKKIAWKELKKRIWLWLAGVIAGTSEFWGPILIGLIVISFCFGITYYYWDNHHYDMKQWYYFLTMQPEKLIINAITNTADTTYSGAKASETTGGKSTGESAEGAKTETTNK